MNGPSPTSDKKPKTATKATNKSLVGTQKVPARTNILHNDVENKAHIAKEKLENGVSQLKPLATGNDYAIIF